MTQDRASLDRASLAARRAANHCAELTGRAAASGEAATRFAEAAADLVQALGLSLSALLGGARLRVTGAPVESHEPGALAERIGVLAANCVLDFAHPGAGAQVVASLSLSDLLALTDRVFGGDGEVPATLPAELPLTADLVAAQVEGLLADAFAAALAPFDRPQIAARGADLGRLAPFAALEQCRTFALTVSEPGNRDWTILLALCPASFATLFAATPRPAGAPSARDPLACPLGDLPLALEAVVAEFTMPLAQLSRLRPGDTIPLALSREIPLKILETTIAYGSVGAADERVALQLTRVFCTAAIRN